MTEEFKQTLFDYFIGKLPNEQGTTEEIFKDVTTGASNDIERATNLARSMVSQYGMSSRFGMVALESIQNKYLDGRNVRNCSETTATYIDDEVMKIINEAYEKAKALLLGNRAALDKISQFLLEKETITGKEFMDILKQVQEEEKEDSENK